MAVDTTRQAWQYTGDDGTVYRITATEYLVSQGVLGGAAADGTEPALPHGLKPRIVLFEDAAGKAREFIVYAAGAGAYTAGTALNVNVGGVLVAYHSRANRRGEIFRDRKTAAAEASS